MVDVAVTRDDRLLAIEAIAQARNLLYLLFVESNAPLPAMGVKRWSDKLTDDQRTRARGVADRRAGHGRARRAHDDVVRAFIEQARPICARLGVDWPEALEAADVAHSDDTASPPSVSERSPATGDDFGPGVAYEPGDE